MPFFLRFYLFFLLACTATLVACLPARGSSVSAEEKDRLQPKKSHSGGPLRRSRSSVLPGGMPVFFNPFFVRLRPAGTSVCPDSLPVCPGVFRSLIPENRRTDKSCAG